MIGATSGPPAERPAEVNPLHCVCETGGEVRGYAFATEYPEQVSEFEATFECAAAGEYAVFVGGRSDPAEGVFAKALVTIDGDEVGEPELTSRTWSSFAAGRSGLTEGRHRLRVKYTNDLYKAGQDRNLFLQGVGFRREK